MWLWLSGFVYCFCGGAGQHDVRVAPSVLLSTLSADHRLVNGLPVPVRPRGLRRGRTEKMVLKILLHFRRGGGRQQGELRVRARQLAAAVVLRKGVECACERASEGSTCVLPPVSWPPLSRPPSETPFDSRGQSAPRFKTLPDVMHVSCLRHRRPRRRRRLPSFLPSACSNSQLTYMSYMYLGLS